MAKNVVKGFQTDRGIELYDYNSLANKPTLITQAQLEAVQAAANKYTDDEIAKIEFTGESDIELDSTLKIEGKAADAKAVGDALDNKLGSDQLQSAINNALAQAKDSGEFKGEPGDDYILTDSDKTDIANIVLNLLPMWIGGSY